MSSTAATTSEPQEILLYDLARRGDRNSCWSFNVWKVRLVLNYKDIPYRTEWVNHANIAEVLKEKT
jgi:hypothetical protein